MGFHAGSLGCWSHKPCNSRKNTTLAQTPLQAVGERHLPVRAPCKEYQAQCDCLLMKKNQTLLRFYRHLWRLKAATMLCWSLRSQQAVLCPSQQGTKEAYTNTHPSGSPTGRGAGKESREPGTSRFHSQKGSPFPAFGRWDRNRDDTQRPFPELRKLPRG